MKVRPILSALVIGALTSSTVVATAQTSAAAWPVSTYNTGAINGRTVGAVTWYNRSVHVQGNIQDWVGGAEWSQARFTFYIGERVHYTTTRTVSNGTRSYNFDVSATNVPGGITDIVVEYVTEYGVGLGGTTLLERP